MSPPKPLMYAELLSNIRQISVIVALEEPCDLTTRVELSADGWRFILRHSEEASSLSLPGQVSPGFQLQRPVFGAKELTWRLPLAGEPTCTSMDTMQSNCAPWSAKYLGKETEFVCRGCGSEIVKKGSIGTWRDLPSENWAEMMDFWHCHKPEVPDGHVEQSAANRGYGANTKFTPTPGIGFVDLTSFLLADTDCQNTQTESSPEEPSQHQSILCKACHSFIGYIDHQATGSRLYKWRLRSNKTSQLLLKNTSPGSSTSPSLATIIGAQLAASMQSQGLSRFVLLPARWMPTSQESAQQAHKLSRSSNGLFHAILTSASTFSTVSMNVDDLNSMVGDTAYSGQSRGSWRSTYLTLWILTPSLRFSRNTTQTNLASGSPTSLRETEPESGTLAMKVFWKTLTVEAAEKLVGSNGVEEILLPNEAICGIEACLQSSSSFLPPSARKFQNWDVGLLERYEE
ncbi:HECT-like ubiquitin-conjugating enzyme-binding-domain-containing protein [Hyaloscypha sp. PMI_1271]|nr:HECT-like ubiquitin-conjugating enzyme-binding-domain-containing protein [Hyaloscypha sp. PMI_1271]